MIFVKAVVRFLAGLPLVRPLRSVVERERLEALAVTADPVKVNIIAGFALWAVIEDVMTELMALSFYASLSQGDFVTYHAVTPWFKITGAVAFMVAANLRGISYWLIYAIPTILVAGQTILLLLIHGVVTPEDLSFMDWGPSWWRSQG